MSEMVERVARAICSATPGTGDVDGHFSGNFPIARDFWMTQARAAIEAMREPTAAMRETPLPDPLQRYDHPIFESRRDLRPTIWKAMIDAALK